MSSLRLLRRRLRADLGVLLVVGALVLATVLIGCLGIRWLTHRADAALQQTAVRAPALTTGIATNLDTRADAVMLPDQLDRLTTAFGSAAEPPLRRVLEEPTWSTLRTRVPFSGLRGRYVDAPHLVDLRGLAALEDHVVLVEGRLPGVGSPLTGPSPDQPAVVEAVLLRGDADTLGLVVGDRVPLEVAVPVTSDPGPPLPPGAVGPTVRVPGGAVIRQPLAGPVSLEMTGIVEQDDPTSAYWAAFGFGLGGYVEGLGGNAPPILRGTALLGRDAQRTAAPTVLGTQLRLTWWQPLRPDRLRVDEVDEVTDSVRAYRSAATLMGRAPESVRSQMRTDLDSVLLRYANERSTVLVAMAVAVSGLVAVAVLVVLLAVSMVAGRWEAGVALSRARGSSSAQEAWRAAVVGALVALPAAAAGIALAAELRPAPVGPAPLVLGAAVALVVVALLALAAARAGRQLRPGRSEEAAGRPTRRQLVLEAFLLVACLGSLLLARRRAATGEGPQLDLLLASVPWLLALVASLVATHLAQPLLRRLARRLARRRGSVGFLALARASRSGSAGRLVGLAVVTTLATTLFTAAVAGAVERGQEESAWTATQGDLRLDDAQASEADIDAVRSLPGVAAAAEIVVDDTARLGMQQSSATLVGLEVAEFARLAARSPLRTYDDLRLRADGRDGVVPAVANSAAARLAGPAPVTVESAESALEVEVVDTVAEIPFDTDVGGVVLVVPIEALRALGPAYATADTVLVRLDAGAGSDTVSAVEDLVPGPTRTTLRTDELTAMRDAPFSQLLRRAYVLTAVATAAYAVLAILLWLVVTAAARTAFLSVLRTLGTTSRQSGRLVLVELLPTVTVALLTGVITGWALTWVAAPSLDVTGLTRGSPAPLANDPVTVLALVGGTALVVLGAVVGSLAYLRRRRPIDVLRLGGES